MNALSINQPRQIGAYVRRVREGLGETRAQLAHRAGVSERLLASLELGDATGIRLDKLLAICRALDIALLAQLPEAAEGSETAGARSHEEAVPVDGQSPVPEPSDSPEDGRSAYEEAYLVLLQGQGVRLPHANNAGGEEGTHRGAH